MMMPQLAPEQFTTIKAKNACNETLFFYSIFQSHVFVEFIAMILDILAQYIYIYIYVAK